MRIRKVSYACRDDCKPTVFRCFLDKSRKTMLRVLASPSLENLFVVVTNLALNSQKQDKLLARESVIPLIQFVRAKNAFALDVLLSFVPSQLSIARRRS